MGNWLRNIGPGPFIAAAFIGPGTVTVCTLAGVNFGYALLWAIGLSIIATITLQEMAARLGIITQKGLSQIIKQEIHHPISKFLVSFLIISAIVVGNAAYEAGNISGGVLGLQSLLQNSEIEMLNGPFNFLPLFLGVIAFVLLYIGNYKVLEKTLIVMVVLMSLSFIATAIITKPDIIKILEGVFVPNFPEKSTITILALIGTTVVPYNLFLHASLAQTKWKSEKNIKSARKDTIVAVTLGGLVSMCIIISAVSIQSAQVESAVDLAKGLEPLFGSSAKYFLATGLCAAGITSAITAPLAASYVASGILGWSPNLKSKPFRAVWLIVLVCGVVFSSIGFKAVEIIKFAQLANGLLLPLVAGFLIWVANRSKVLGKYRNTRIQNILGIIILLITIFLGGKVILSVLKVI